MSIENNESIKKLSDEFVFLKTVSLNYINT